MEARKVRRWRGDNAVMPWSQVCSHVQGNAYNTVGRRVGGSIARLGISRV